MFCHKNIEMIHENRYQHLTRNYQPEGQHRPKTRERQDYYGVLPCLQLIKEVRIRNRDVRPCIEWVSVNSDNLRKPEESPAFIQNQIALNNPTSCLVIGWDRCWLPVRHYVK